MQTLTEIANMNIALVSPYGLVAVAMAFISGYLVRAAMSWQRRRAERALARQRGDRLRQFDA